MGRLSGGSSFSAEHEPWIADPHERAAQRNAGMFARCGRDDIEWAVRPDGSPYLRTKEHMIAAQSRADKERAEAERQAWLRQRSRLDAFD